MLSVNMRKFRIEKSISQKELAEELGVTQANISSWEVGRTEPNIGMAKRIAEALGVTLCELLGEEPPAIYVSNIDNAEQVLIEMSRKLDDRSRNELFLYALELLKGVNKL